MKRASSGAALLLWLCRGTLMISTAYRTGSEPKTIAGALACAEMQMAQELASREALAPVCACVTSSPDIRSESRMQHRAIQRRISRVPN